MKGLFITLGLVIAVGMQSAFVLKQGIMRNHILVAVLICAFCDAFLITLGVNGFGELWTTNRSIEKIANWGGIIFLTIYSIKSFYSAFKKNNILTHNDTPVSSLKHVILISFSVSLFNPHAFLDTCIVMSGISSSIPLDLKTSFTIGAIVASFIWLSILGFGAKYLRKFFEKPKSWKILDFIIGVMMMIIAISLMRSIL
tara:strand:- start:266 stop:862 length:597 start_codon:yes stop_codon:yes gene_type:complete